MENVTAFLLAEVGLLALAVFLLPTLVELRHGRVRRWVVALNIALGWTVVGWAAALVAALRVPSSRPRPPAAPRRESPAPAAAPPPSAPLSPI